MEPKNTNNCAHHKTWWRNTQHIEPCAQSINWNFGQQVRLSNKMHVRFVIISVILALGSATVGTRVTGITDSITLHAENDTVESVKGPWSFSKTFRDTFSHANQWEGLLRYEMEPCWGKMGFSQSDFTDTDVLLQINTYHGEDEEKWWEFHCNNLCKMHLVSGQIYLAFAEIAGSNTVIVCAMNKGYIYPILSYKCFHNIITNVWDI